VSQFCVLVIDDTALPSTNTGTGHAVNTLNTQPLSTGNNYTYLYIQLVAPIYFPNT